jgi:hypothetical protein
VFFSVMGPRVSVSTLTTMNKPKAVENPTLIKPPVQYETMAKTNWMVTKTTMSGQFFPKRFGSVSRTLGRLC